MKPSLTLFFILFFFFFLNLASLSDKSQFGYFFRTTPTNLLYSDAAMAFIISQGWPVMGVLYSDDDFGQQCKILIAKINQSD
ncbi:MAG: hypothetical protein JSY10_13630 [Paenibacillus sp.]|nr:hypothetical protein [Paenibacillus sp.]